MSSVGKTTNRVNATATTPIVASSLETTATTRAAVFAALAKIAEKEGDRDQLVDGATHQVAIEILAKVDGVPFEANASAMLSVGHASTRASSTTPNVAHVLALVLGKLNAATRDKILSELPEDFERNGGLLPEVAETAIEAADNMLRRLRAKVQTTVRGSVSCKYAFGS